MAGVKLKDIPFKLDEIDELIEILELFDKGLIVEKIRLQLGCAQSHVSRRKGAVRDLLDDPVLERGGPQGMQLTPRARVFLEALRQTRKVVEAALGPERFGSVDLRVGSIPSVLSSFLPRVFERLVEAGYFEKYPHIALRMESGPASQLFEKLDRGLLDVVITYPLRDANLDSRPPKKVQERTDEEGWHPMEVNPWIQSKDIYERPLFPGLPVGLIYHGTNKVMKNLAGKPASFSFVPLESMMVFLTSDQNQPAFEAEIERWLPEPKRAEGTKIYLQSFNQIRAALTRGGLAVLKKAVGVGVEIPGDTELNFLDFGKVAARLPPDSPAAEGVKRLARLSVQTFNAYRRSGQTRTAEQITYLRAFTDAIEAAAVGYFHPYVS